jgi:hypothetical protein
MMILDAAHSMLTSRCELRIQAIDEPVPAEAISFSDKDNLRYIVLPSSGSTAPMETEY